MEYLSKRVRWDVTNAQHAASPVNLCRGALVLYVSEKERASASKNLVERTRVVLFGTVASDGHDQIMINQ